MPLTKAQARKIALSFPGALEKSSYGSPAIFIDKKLFVSIGTREPNTIMLRTSSVDERDMLIEADPETFFITDHYKNYPAMLARLAHLDAKTLRAMLQRRWREIAPKKLLKER
jgi:hypothetical protein